jgi:Zn-dependent peptidase ImmA (M78 family)
MKLRELFVEQEQQPDLIQAFRDFLPLAMKELKIKQLPRIKLKKHIPKGDQPTFGKFVNDENTIYLGIEDRQPIDTLRTLAHELVHFKQFEQGRMGSNSGDTGSPIEDEAHKVAGVIMRHFDKKFPRYFGDEALDID